jgi:HD-GYP domain-containing protein (c-di-GMP phosphodiesterase class II)
LNPKVLELIVHHHERYDGAGYPDGLRGSDIPLGAQIIAVADTYDAMTSDRPYRKGFSRERALKLLTECAGTQFSPKVLHAFRSLFKSEQGSLQE